MWYIFVVVSSRSVYGWGRACRWVMFWRRGSSGGNWIEWVVLVVMFVQIRLFWGMPG